MTPSAFQPKHGTAERWDTCDCIECRRATGCPIAPAIRCELAALLKSAADKADEWCKAAHDEWAPLAVDYYAGNGEVTPAIEGPYIEHRLAMAIGNNIRRMFDQLDDERGRMKRFIAKQVVPIHSPTPDTPSEALFERLAVEDPERLLAMLVSNELRPALLTYAAEIAGRGLPSEQCVPVLIQLLHHGAAVVREGAVYGLAEHPVEVVTAKLRQVAENDSSAGVRAAATGALEDR